MELESSVPHLQVPAASPYSEPARSSPYPPPPTPLPEDNTSFTEFLFPFPLLRLYQRISPGPRHIHPFSQQGQFLRRGVVSTSPNLQAGRQPFVGRPRLIQYITSYPPYWRSFLQMQPEDLPCLGDRDPLIVGASVTLPR